MKNRKSLICLAVLTLAVFVCMIFANMIQTDNGNVKITEGYLQYELGDMYYKLYVPSTANSANKAPAVLLLHGYQNDHETCAAYAIELARRGVVVMSLDEYGHGWTKAGLANRGFVNHKVTVNYGEDSEADGTFVSIGGANRYRIMMNFSNLSFFNEHYSADSDGNIMTDSSCGGVFAYAALADMEMVDNERMGVSGHSMGTWSSWTVAAAYSGTPIEPKATVLQCGELFTDKAYDSGAIHFNNVLLLQAKYDEFSYFRDYENTVSDDLLKSDLRTGFLGTTAGNAAWNTTFGRFSDGSARRIQLLMTNHRLTTHNAKGLATAIEWFEAALGFTSDIPSGSQRAMTKETLVLIAMLCAIFAMLPLMELLLETPFFSGVKQALPSEEGILPRKKWWLNACVTMVLAGITYPFMTQLGHGLLPLPEKVFRMTIGDGFLSYYGLLIIIMFIMTAVSLKKAGKNGQKDRYYNIGLGTEAQPDRFGWALAGKSALLACCMVCFMYVIVWLCETLFHLDLRFIWPFFKTFTGERFLQFLVYILLYMLFFVLNNSKALASLRTRSTYKAGFGGFLSCWVKNAFVMTGGVIAITLLEYIPFFAELGPGADLLFGSTFGGPFMSLLIVFLPQILVFSILAAYIYRRTANVFTGAFVSAALACWIVTGGSSML
ncbi:MAG: hypothetical protein K6C12_05770 [Oscillospiraceae bacterium]|nr:hypothetical protein [Oscillospiraceae bacterium]